jgi:hypothetical protein
MDGPGLEQPGNPGKPAGDKVHPTFTDGLTGDPSRKEGFQAELPCIPGIDGHGISQTHQLNQFQVLKVGSFRGHKMLDQRPRFGHTRPQKNTHARFNPLKNLFG